MIGSFDTTLRDCARSFSKSTLAHSVFYASSQDYRKITSSVDVVVVSRLGRLPMGIVVCACRMDGCIMWIPSAAAFCPLAGCGKAKGVVDPGGDSVGELLAGVPRVSARSDRSHDRGRSCAHYGNGGHDERNRHPSRSVHAPVLIGAWLLSHTPSAEALPVRIGEDSGCRRGFLMVLTRELGAVVTPSTRIENGEVRARPCIRACLICGLSFLALALTTSLYAVTLHASSPLRT